ncbi:MAG: hypothetical protein ABIZ56_06615, partial [Chthoniobacteraceae bacterium]
AHFPTAMQSDMPQPFPLWESSSFASFLRSYCMVTANAPIILPPTSFQSHPLRTGRKSALDFADRFSQKKLANGPEKSDSYARDQAA